MSTQAVERYQQPLAPDILNERELRALQAQAAVFAKTDLVPKALKNKPDDVLLVMMTAREIGMRPLAAVGGALFPIDGKVGMLAQTMIGLAEQAGHDIWLVEEGDDFCTVAGQRRGSKRVSKVTFTLKHARQMGLLDMWVEKWEKDDNNKWRKADTCIVGDVIDGIDEQVLADAPDWVKKQVRTGRLKFRDSWKKSPPDMMWARAVARLCRRRFSDALLGLHPYTPDELGLDDDEVEAEVLDQRHVPIDEPDDDGPDVEDIVDGELVEDENEGSGHDADRVSATAPPLDAEPPPSGDGDNGGEPAVDAPTDPAPTLAGVGDSEDGHGKPAASEAPAGEPAKKNPYAEAVHLYAADLGLPDEALDAILHDITGDVSANAVTRENRPDVIKAISAWAARQS